MPFSLVTSADKLIPAILPATEKRTSLFGANLRRMVYFKKRRFFIFLFPVRCERRYSRSGDFDGDGKTDAAFFVRSTQTWYILKSSDGGITIEQFGVAGDFPVVGRL